MESYVKVNCTEEEMNDLFLNNKLICVKLYEKINDNLYGCLLRHKELKTKLHGMYNILQLKELLC